MTAASTAASKPVITIPGTGTDVSGLQRLFSTACCHGERGAFYSGNRNGDTPDSGGIYTGR